MAKGVTIDFERAIGFSEVSGDLHVGAFPTTLEDGSRVELKIEISNEAHALLPNVYNLAFGPVDRSGRINDLAQLPHRDHSAVFSTILLAAFNYLDNNPGHYLGVDGSNNARAFLYWHYLQQNYDYLAHYFVFFGLKHYVRISRFGKTQYDNPFDFKDILSLSDEIQKTKTWPEQMYNYFTFTLK